MQPWLLLLRQVQMALAVTTIAETQQHPCRILSGATLPTSKLNLNCAIPSALTSGTMSVWDLEMVLAR
jgi:hypothetical protein